MKYSIRSVAVSALLACGATGAMAALAVSDAVPAGTARFSDNSAERWIDNNNNGILDVGDALRGIFSIDNVKGSGPSISLGAGSAYNELTGLFQVVVTARTFATTDPVIGNLFNYTFGYDSSFGYGAGVIGVLFEDAAQNFVRDNCGGANDAAACEATAKDGNVWASVGFGGTGFWSAKLAAENPLIGSLLDYGTPLGTFGMGLDFITNNTGYLWNKVGCTDTVTGIKTSVDVCGQGGVLASGNLLTDGLATPYGIFDNVDFTMNRVPEPGTMALMGLALFGLGASRRNRKA